MTALRKRLKAKEVADLLGFDVSTIYRMAQEHELPAERIGKSWRFDEADVLAWLAAKKTTNLRTLPGGAA